MQNKTGRTSFSFLLPNYCLAKMVNMPECNQAGTPELECLDFSGKTVYGDFRDDFVRDGFAVIKNVVSEEKAAHYVSEIHQWLEDL